MNILRAELSNFGLFQQRTFEFAPGLNIVFGPNESGKTTLHRFLVGMFYGFKKPGAKRRVYLPERERYRPWQGGEYAGALEYEWNGHRYRLERDFANDRFRVLDAVTGGDCTSQFQQDATREYDVALRHLGFSALAFERTISIAQTDSSLSGKEQRDAVEEIRSRLANVVQGGDESISVRQALQRLDRAIALLGTPNARTKPFGRIHQQYEQLLEERNDAMRKLAEVQALVREQRALEKEREKAENARRQAEYAHRKVQLAVLQRRLRRATAISEELSRIEKERVEAEASLRRMPDFEQLELEWGNPELALERLRHQEQLLSRLWDELGQVGEQNEEVARRLDKLGVIARMPLEKRDIMSELRQRFEALRLEPYHEQLADLNGRIAQTTQRAAHGAVMRLAAIAGTIGLGTTLWLFDTSFSWLVSTALLVVLLLALYNENRLAAVRRALNECRSEEATLRERLSKAEQEKRHLQQEIEELLQAANVSGLNAWEAGWQQRDQLEAKRSWLEGRKRRLETNIAEANEEQLAIRVAIGQLLGVSGCVESPKTESNSRYATTKHAVIPGQTAVQLQRASWTNADLEHYFAKRLEWHETKNRLKEIDEAWTRLQTERQALLAGWTLEQLREATARAKEAVVLCQRQRAEQTAMPTNPDFTVSDAHDESPEERNSLEEFDQTMAGLSDHEDAYTDADLPDFEMAWRAAEEQCLRLERREQQVAAEITARLTDRTLADVEEELLLVRKEYEELRLRLDALQLARRAIVAAAEGIQREFAPELNSKAGVILDKLSGGRYRRMYIDEEFEVRVHAPGQSRLIELASLSAGTIDLVQFSVRLATAELISGNRNFPLFLDDPFAQADEQRLRASLSTISNISREHQIILFTCHRPVLDAMRELRLEYHLVDLGGR